jgi:polyisoprenoid-binding protein YceI
MNENSCAIHAGFIHAWQSGVAVNPPSPLSQLFQPSIFMPLHGRIFRTKSLFISQCGAAWLAILALSVARVNATPAPLLINPEQSRVEVVVKATVDSFIALLPVYQATINVDNGRVTDARFTFEFADVHTGKAARDEAMLAWEDAEHHPRGAFTLESITGEAGRLTARGELNLHDVVRKIAFPITISKDKNVYAIDGEATLDTRDFGLSVIRKFGLLKVDPLVKVRFHLQGSEAVPATQPAPAAR